MKASFGLQSAVVPQCLDYPSENTGPNEDAVLKGLRSTRGLSSSPSPSQPPILDMTALPGSQHGTLSTESIVLKNAHFDSTSGHDTATVEMPRSLFILPQVSLKGAYPFRDNNVLLLAVSWPPNSVKRFRDCVTYLWRLLLLEGDVEANPGPMTKSQEEKLDFVFNTVQGLDSSSVGILESVNRVLQIHIGLKSELEQLTRHVSELEAKIQSDASEKIPLICEELLSILQNQFDQFERKIT